MMGLRTGYLIVAGRFVFPPGVRAVPTLEYGLDGHKPADYYRSQGAHLFVCKENGRKQWNIRLFDVPDMSFPESLDEITAKFERIAADNDSFLWWIEREKAVYAAGGVKTHIQKKDIAAEPDDAVCYRPAGGRWAWNPMRISYPGVKDNARDLVFYAATKLRKVLSSRALQARYAAWPLECLALPEVKFKRARTPTNNNEGYNKKVTLYKVHMPTEHYRDY